MNRSFRFDLERALSTWRRMAHAAAHFLSQDLDELERHVRDQVAAAVARGEDEETAFRLAIREMGDLSSLGVEYRKVYWEKIRRRRLIRTELRWRIQMLANYFKIALRVMSKQKVYAFINVFGLAVGIAFCTLILLYVRDELTFDAHHENADRIFRVNVAQRAADGSIESEYPWQPYPVAKALEADIPAIESTVRLMDRNLFVRVGNESSDEHLLFADPKLLTAFTFPLVEGSSETALPNLDSVVLSERAARKWFGTESALGKTIEVRFDNTFKPLVITGVARNAPSNSSIRFDYLLPFERLATEYEWIADRTERWNASSFFVYAVLNQQADVRDVRALLPTLRDKYYPDQEKRLRAEGMWTGKGAPYAYALQPLRDIHLNKGVSPGLTPPSDPLYSWILAAIALSILLLACINYTTLAIGRSASRTREIGLRKVVGANRGQLVGQFGGEAFIMSVLAFLLGLGLAELFLPTFNDLANKQLAFGFLNSITVPAGLAALVVLVALLAGFYPTIVLSRLRPTDMLRRRARLGGSRGLTTALVVFQFTLSIALISGMSVMRDQMTFVQTKNIGYDKDHVVVVPTSGMTGERLLARFKDELDGRPEILGVTGMTSAFSHGYSREGWNYGDEQKSAYVYRIESNFLDVMDIPLVLGRSFSADRTSDSTRSVIVNEALVRDFGWDDPVGEVLRGFYEEPEVVGVVSDVNFMSLHNDVEPMIFSLDPDWGISHMLFQVRPERVEEALSLIRTTWRHQAPEVPFTYSFLDEDLAGQYVAEARWSRIVSYSSMFAILIACLGLFGLASISVSGRSKEIGIRRALGASVTGLAARLSGEFVRLVALAVVFAVPLAWIVLERWLDHFAYRVDVGMAVFLLAVTVSLGMALITVGFQTVRAARGNPVDSLRTE